MTASSLAQPTWVIGDIQGCREPLQRLLTHPDIAADGDAARFWVAGDLVNRGPDSAGVLRDLMAMGDQVTCILGNHDLHLLGVAAGVRPPSKADTLDDILDAPDAAELLDWLRHRPMAHAAPGVLMVHAGVLAPWTVDQTLGLAREVETLLRDDRWREHIGELFGNEPKAWDKRLKGVKRARLTVNALTRLRMCRRDGSIQYGHKDAPSQAHKDLVPWFDVPGRATAGTLVCFGHWSTLGLMVRPDAVCLDTGCVWNGRLTAMRLQDRLIVSVPARV